MSDNSLYWIALKSVDGLGDITIRKLVDKFGSPERVFRADKEEISDCCGSGQKIYDAISSFSQWDKAEEEVRRIERSGYKIVSITDSQYPRNLINIYDPPSVLYLSGNLSESDSFSLAVVGSRLCDSYGRKITRKIVSGLCENNITVVSGLARGVDAVAHRTCLENKSRTLAVLGCGIDIRYPAENKKLYDEIPQNGGILSEFRLGSSPDAGNFPKRNRIISGLSLGVLVVQASRRSGSLITAKYAVEQNREVFAIPGNITSELSSGTSKLLKSGAKLVESVNDIFEEILDFRGLVYTSDEPRASETTEINETEKVILSTLKGVPKHIDEIAVQLNLDTKTVLTILLELELKELVEQLPGKYFQSI